MRDRFYTSISKLINPSKKILLAVSGGIDSVVLLNLAYKSNLNFSVAHANFQLRADESNGDEQFVRELSEKYKAPFFTNRFNTKDFAKKKGISTQMAARELRYQWFSETMSKEKIDYVVTAHHLSDNLETALLNFTRGTGVSGMRGMVYQSANLIRPLLAFTREEIELYANSEKLTWREDSSNYSVDYSRNYLRHEVIPKLKKINPSLETTFENNATRFNAEEELVRFAISQLSVHYVSNANQQVIIKKKMLDHFDNKVGVLWEFSKDFGFNVDQCRSIIDSVSGESGKQFHASEFTLSVDRESFIISKQPIESFFFEIKETDKLVLLNSFELSIEEPADLQFSASPLEAFLDKESLTFPLIVRNWKKGDSFFPLGMKQKKKVSDFLIDQKISMPDKNQVLVVESNNAICWVIGYRIDDRFKVTSDTKSVISLKINNRIS
jgi:tRNA(Ile)-lysidine synthase